MKHTVYVELDALLDTRLATVSRLNQQAAVDLLKSEAYFERRSDELGRLTDLITTEDYRAQYDKRDVLTLMASRPTDLYAELKSIILNLEAKIVNIQQVTSAEVLINIYPYDLTKEEQVIIVESVVSMGNFTVPVYCINVPYSEMSLEYLAKEKWSALIFYNFSEWLETTFNKPDFNPETSVKLTGIPFYVPALLKNLDEDLTDDERRLPNGKVMSHHEGMKLALSPFFNVDYLTTETFCIYRQPPEKKE